MKEKKRNGKRHTKRWFSFVCFIHSNKSVSQSILGHLSSLSQLGSYSSIFQTAYLH